MHSGRQARAAPNKSCSLFRRLTRAPLRQPAHAIPCARVDICFPIPPIVEMPTIRTEITLTAAEKDLFETLINATRFHSLPTTLRCAGGWVRDKLIGQEKETPDIDIALDDMLGKDFAEKVRSSSGWPVLRRPPLPRPYPARSLLNTHR